MKNYQPKQCTIISGKCIKVTLHLNCLNPPNMGNDPSFSVYRNQLHKNMNFCWAPPYNCWHWRQCGQWNTWQCASMKHGISQRHQQRFRFFFCWTNSRATRRWCLSKKNKMLGKSVLTSHGAIPSGGPSHCKKKRGVLIKTAHLSSYRMA